MPWNDLGISRRQFITRAAAFTIIPAHVLGRNGQTTPSEKLNLAYIGAGGRARANLDGLRGHNVVALCDVDDRRAAESYKEYPQAQRFKDFRKMLDAVGKDIDAAVVSTPDHTHAVAAMRVIQMGKHLYCEKPLAHSIHEVRALTEAARKAGIVTQLGNQGHSSEHIRLFCEWIRDGAIGPVREIHAGCSSDYGRMELIEQVQKNEPIPAELDWDLWLGPVSTCPFSSLYVPGKWRGWSRFGTGVIGDWVCHVLDPVAWALDLTAPKRIWAETGEWNAKDHGATFPHYAKVHYEFPAKGDRPPVKIVWHSGKAKIPRPEELEAGREHPGTGAVVIGDKGKIMYGSHGAGGCRIIPEEKMKAYERPEKTIPRVRNHHQDWVDAIKEGRAAGSNFDYGGPLTEIALLGVIAMRFGERKLEWDAAAMRFTNCDEANASIKPTFRAGWRL